MRLSSEASGLRQIKGDHMQTYSAQALHRVSSAIFRAVGAPEDIADDVSTADGSAGPAFSGFSASCDAANGAREVGAVAANHIQVMSPPAVAAATMATAAVTSGL